uniref:Uncharacterized protein LOC114346190 n=1 Tax=Diabrotica virgifera virgifera TaxID=50390 RepID=A0A6P7GSH4_DIAVI
MELGTKEQKTWTSSQTKLLLSLYTEMSVKVGKVGHLKTKKKMWKAISAAMAEKGHSFTEIQVENKYKSLDRQYKATIRNNKLTGRSRATFEFTKELDEINLEKKTLFPEYLLGRRGSGSSTDDLKRKAGLVTVAETVSRLSPIATCSSHSDIQEVTSPISPGTETTRLPPAQKRRSTVEEIQRMNEQKDRELSIRQQEIELEGKMLQAYKERTSVIKKKMELAERYIVIEETKLGINKK